MVFGVGIDIVEVSRFENRSRDAHDKGWPDIFTANEIAYCNLKRYPERHFAARFAAKEAFLKALGSGARTPGEFLQVEVVLDDLGAPGLALTGEIARRSKALGVTTIKISLTHTATTAAAVAVVEL